MLKKNICCSLPPTGRNVHSQIRFVSRVCKFPAVADAVVTRRSDRMIVPAGSRAGRDFLHQASEQRPFHCGRRNTGDFPQPAHVVDGNPMIVEA